MARLAPPASPADALRGYGVLAHAPDVLEAFLALYGGLWQEGAVDHGTKEVVRLRNARTTNCGY